MVPGNRRDCHTKRVEDFSKVTEQYFGSPVEVVKYSGNYLYIHGRVARLHYTTLAYVTYFYTWRLQHNTRSDIPIGGEDFSFFTTSLRNKTMNIESVAAVLGVSDAALRYNFKELHDIQEAYKKVLSGKKGKAETFTWDGFTGSTIEWALRLDIAIPSFRVRLHTHGICHLLFMTREEYAAVPVEERNMYVGTRVKKVYAVRGRVLPPPERIAVITAPRTKADVGAEYDTLVKLLTALITDSKDNLIINKEPYFTDSKRFLMNQNGLLKYYLECIAGVDIDSCLEELHNYATEGYKKHTVTLNRRKTPNRVAEDVA